MISIGVIGYSSGDFDQDRAQLLVQLGLDFLADQSGDPDVCVVSGLTRMGIPELAYEWAVQRSWRTVGIACSRAREYPLFPVDETIIVGDSWGDESATFIDHIDCLLRVGGGEQSLAEAAEFVRLKPQAVILQLELPRHD